ncbi:carbohydrate-binding module family 24 protein [Amniculicola lignicola CBS 123094]|uniref:Carbohydrate-binding module family 24 protein n=1 Tax=Amniculicola lignicola CBS 123094 TaxID=1392246 RepID=A0A6A5WWV7_9PLEO|nr:carbohydrate-binding module family 24 protein [Amniculicola lignicola CBS 123094]
MGAFIIALALLGPTAVSAKSVFAHFMVCNTANFTETDWRTQIGLTQTAKIDAFALNMAKDEATTKAQLPSAFTAAEALQFKLFFSFDYAGNGDWNKATVTGMVNQRRASAAYFKYNSKPSVSSFGGPASGADWKNIKTAIGCYFIPGWPSLGAKTALEVAGGVADGLFSWDAWPSGSRSMITYPDASYFNFLSSKKYMALVSPWFYTNLPGYEKNWPWRGDSFWVDRWNHLISGEFQPEFFQIISWNDYGESHYIAPLDDSQYAAFTTGRASYNYVINKPHNGWRELLPYFITLWKTRTASIMQESIVSWYRQHPKGACSSGNTTGNTASQLQVEVAPSVTVQDEICFAAPLGSAATVSVTIGGVAVAATWNVVPTGGVGIYSGSAPTGGRTGTVIITLARSGTTIVQITGWPISPTCTNGLNNYNAYVGSMWGVSITARSPTLAVSKMKCARGFGANGFAGLCEWRCAHGYCPEAASFGTKPIGYTLSGLSPAYDGLCAFVCARDYCPSTACSYTKGTTDCVAVFVIGGMHSLEWCLLFKSLFTKKVSNRASVS